MLRSQARITKKPPFSLMSDARCRKIAQFFWFLTHNEASLHTYEFLHPFATSEKKGWELNAGMMWTTNNDNEILFPFSQKLRWNVLLCVWWNVCVYGINRLVPWQMIKGIFRNDKLTIKWSQGPFWIWNFHYNEPETIPEFAVA